jgi:hypothetical protein
MSEEERAGIVEEEIMISASRQCASARMGDSLDLAPCDFYLFPKLKGALKGTHFQSVDEVKSKPVTLLNQLMTRTTALNSGKFVFSSE